MNRLLRRLLLPVLAIGVLLALAPRPAGAHPMGNFTVNHYSALTVGANQVQVLYVLDMAEIPTYQELGTIREDHSPELTPAQRDTYLARKSAELLPGLHLTLNGQPLALAAAGAPELSLPLGAGDLPTLRLVLHLAAPLATAQQGALAYQDTNYADRAGWKEIIAQAGAGATVSGASVPAVDESVALTQYRSDLLVNPPQVTQATLQFALGATTDAAAAPAPAPAPSAPQDALAWARSRSDALTDLMGQKELPLGALLFGLVLAFGFGAAHALSPGHGKTIVAAYLVGSRGTAIHAAFLGLIVTVSHTLGVFLLGLLVLYASEFIVPEQLYPWLGTLSGGLIAVLGAGLFFQRWRAWRRRQGAVLFAAAPDAHDHASDHGHTHDHPHDHAHAHTHDHDHDHSHAADHPHDVVAAPAPHRHGPFGRPHTHGPADGQQVSWGSMLMLGLTSGIIPCPSALVVLLGAVAYHKIGLGLMLILAFSLGLALVLTGIGLAMVYGQQLLRRIRLPGSTALLGRLPMVSALAVACLGVLIAVQALNGTLVLR